MRAIVLCGGKGTRLRARTGDRIPKILAPVGDRTFLDLLLEHLAGMGIEEIHLALGHRAEAVRAHLDRAGSPVPVETVVEDPPLGTGGALRRFAGRFGEPVLAINGDTFLDASLTDLLAAHEREGAFLTIGIGDPPAGRTTGGIVRLDDAGWIVAFEEKGEEPGPVNLGAYILSPAALTAIPDRIPCSLEREAIPAWLAEGRPLLGVPLSGAFFDIGTPERLDRFAAWWQAHVPA